MQICVAAVEYFFTTGVAPTFGKFMVVVQPFKTTQVRMHTGVLYKVDINNQPGLGVASRDGRCILPLSSIVGKVCRFEDRLEGRMRGGTSDDRQPY